MKKIAVLMVMLLVFSSALADEPGGGIWDVYCNVDFAYDGDEQLTLFCNPDGSGSPFSEAHLPDGSIVDATLRVQIFDAFGEPVAAFPAEDMWLEPVGDFLFVCVGGIAADSATDESGWTIWAEPLHVGGFSDSECTLFVNGMYVQGWTDLNLRFNSSDITGDGQVNLSDVSLFSSHYFGSYSFAADLYSDGVLSLADVAFLATGLGTSCP